MKSHALIFFVRYVTGIFRSRRLLFLFLAALSITRATPRASALDSVQPTVDCWDYDPATGMFTAWFGYVSDHNEIISVAPSASNFMLPTPAYRGQPVLFHPGANTLQFAVSWKLSDYPALTWTVLGKSATAGAANLTPPVTFQGRLWNEGAPVNGATEMQFTFFDAPTNGTAISCPQTFEGSNAVQVVNGLFVAQLRWAPAYRNGGAWVEIAARAPGSNYVTLNGRLPLGVTPWALSTRTAVTAETLQGYAPSEFLTGTISDDRLSTNIARLGTPQVFSGSNSFQQPVGIGTTNPAARLEIVGSANQLRLTGPGGPNARSAIEFATYAPGTNQPSLRIEAIDNNWGAALDIASKLTGAATNALVSRLHITAGGWVGIGNTNPATALHVAGTVTATTFAPSSDRNLKENFAPVSPSEVLEALARLPITRWNFIGESNKSHLGPMAQDFHSAFGLGADEKHIATVDSDGVALAAIQGLNQKVEQDNAALRLQLKAREVELDEMKARLRALEELVKPSHR